MICVSFDTDHLDEARLREFLAGCTLPGESTIFCTQRFASLTEEPRYELAPHPYLAEGSDWEPELSAMRQMLPAATGWRSHSCVFSHLLARWVGENGYSYVSIDERFGEPGLKPTRHPMGTVWQMPIYYMDTFDISRQRFWRGRDCRPFDSRIITRALQSEGLHVFDFHPVHVLLNTPDPEFYFAARDRFRAGEPVERLSYRGYGAGVFFQDLCERMSATGARSVTLAEALASHVRNSGEE